jgi:hypothetical protein
MFLLLFPEWLRRRKDSKSVLLRIIGRGRVSLWKIVLMMSWTVEETSAVVVAAFSPN